MTKQKNKRPKFRELDKLERYGIIFTFIFLVVGISFLAVSLYNSFNYFSSKGVFYLEFRLFGESIVLSCLLVVAITSPFFVLYELKPSNIKYRRLLGIFSILSVLSSVWVPKIINPEYSKYITKYTLFCGFPFLGMLAAFFVHYLFKKMMKKRGVNLNNLNGDQLLETLNSKKKGYEMIVFVEDDNHPDQKAFYKILDELGCRWRERYNPTLIMLSESIFAHTVKKYKITGLTMMLGNKDGFFKVGRRIRFGKDVLLNKEKFIKILDAYDAVNAS